MHMQTVEKLKTEWNNFASTKTVGFTFTSIGTGAQNLSTYLTLVDKDDPAVRRSNKRIETLLLVNAVFSFVLVAGNLLLLFCKQLPKVVQDTFDFAEPNDKLQRAHLRINEQKTQSAKSHIQQAVSRVQQTQSNIIVKQADVHTRQAVALAKQAVVQAAQQRTGDSSEETMQSVHAQDLDNAAEALKTAANDLETALTEHNQAVQDLQAARNEQHSIFAGVKLPCICAGTDEDQPAARAAPQVPDGDHLDRGARNIEAAVSPNAGGGSSRGTLAAADRAAAIEGNNVQQLVPPLAHIGTGMYLLNCINVVMAIAIAMMQVLISERVANSGHVLA